MLDRITSTLQFQGEALALRAQRQQVLASNIANADTPNYQARDFDFSQALRSATGVVATGGPAAAGGLALAATSAGHSGGAGAPSSFLPVGTARNPGRVELSWRTPEQPSLDRNTVDLDRERASFADNSMRYEATLRFINGNVRNVLSAIRGE